MNEGFSKMDFFLTEVLTFEPVNVSISSYLWYESIFLLNSIIDSGQFEAFLTNKNDGKKVERIGKKTLGKEIEEIEKCCSLKLQAYINKEDALGECVLIEKETLAFDVINSGSLLASQLMLIRGFSMSDVTYKTKRYADYFELFKRLFDRKP